MLVLQRLNNSPDYKKLAQMASLLPFTLTGNPELVDILDEEWLKATLPDEGELSNAELVLSIGLIPKLLQMFP